MARPLSQDCLEGPGLVLAAHLASNKAQVVLLTPDPPEASVATQQLVSLIRASSRNERVYAEHCDVSDAAEVKAFAKRWTEQTAAGGGHAGALGDMALRLDAIVLGCTDSRALKEPGYVRGQRLTFLREMMPALLRAGQSAPARALVAIPPLYAAIPPDDKAKDDPSVLARTAVASRTLVKELHALRTTLVGAYNSRASHASDVRVEAVSLGYSRTFVLGALSASLSREGRLPLASVARWLILAFALPPVWLLAKSDVEAAQQLIARAMAKATFAPNSEAAASGEATPATSVPQDVPTVWREGREMP